MSSKRDYYEILGVEKTVDGTVLKKAYRKLAFEYHPDRNDEEGAEEKFREISEAYDVLADDQKRQLYDQYGHAGLKQSGFQGFNDVNDIFSSFQSIFDDFFGGGFGGGRQVRGRDLQYRLKLNFREAILGCTRKIKIRRREKCGSCEGSGCAPGTSPEACGTCGGRGKIGHSQGFFMISQPCPHCRGSGMLIRNPCETCRGEKLSAHESSLDVQVPAGVDTGIRLRLNGEGEPSIENGPPGDLFVEIDVETDEVFERDGNDLYTRIHVPYPIAVLGGEVEIPLIEGTKNIKVPKNLKTPHMKIVKHEGVSDLRTKRRGNLIVDLHIATPEKLSAKAKKLIEELKEELPANESPATSSKKGGYFSSWLGAAL